jgi:HAD superfamily hydrolase (TIGR01509 family)
MQVEAILFDADGVIQRPTADRQARWTALIGGAEAAVVSRFKSDIFTVERPCHDGTGDFLSALREVLVKWNCADLYEDTLRTWTAIEVDQAVVDLIASVKMSGVPCYLATNQEPYRARYMTQQLNYGKIFDRLFFSCDLGCSKPDPRYFTAVLAAAHLTPETTLFIDDVEANIKAAESLGISAELFDAEPGTDAVREMRRIFTRYGVRSVRQSTGREGPRP